MDRRDFLKTCGRLGSLGALGGGAAALVRRAQLPGQTCSADGVCSACDAFSGCGLPQALSAKRQVGRPVPGSRPHEQTIERRAIEQDSDGTD